MNHWVDSKTTRLLRQKESLQREVKKLESTFLFRLTKLGESVKEQVDKLTSDFEAETSKVWESCTEIEENAVEVQRGIEAYKAHVDRLANAETKKLQKKVKDLETKLAKLGEKTALRTVNSVEINKAKTIAIFDALLFNISNWSTDGDTAPDFELASQAILFPAVYERVMKGEEAYILEEVPPAALEVVKRGREYVRHFRTTCPLSLMDPSTWETHAKEVQSWWVSDALPLLYGARDPSWEEDAPFALPEMIAWKDYPANRALSFPLIFDGMDHVEKYRDAVRDETGLPRFSSAAVQTRLEANS
jgi:hypothetical protein